MAEGGRMERSVVDPKLLELLACPITKGPLKWDAAKNELVSTSARLAYAVRDGVPVMLPSEARPLDPDKKPPR
jgi:uncharacterized protein YbaR (Trm112 family)